MPEGRPTLTLDFDGVICAPPFGRNLGIHRRFVDPNQPAPLACVWPRWLGSGWDHLRFDWRRPLPEARAALDRLAYRRNLVLLTGRRSSPLGWLRRHGMADYFERIIINEGPWPSAHFKLEQILALGSAEHIDDDGRTAQLLAQGAAVRVFLRSWPRNEGLNFEDGVERVADIAELADLIV